MANRWPPSPNASAARKPGPFSSGAAQGWEELDPEVLLVIEALARANARRDYAAAERAKAAGGRD